MAAIIGGLTGCAAPGGKLTVSEPTVIQPSAAVGGKEVAEHKGVTEYESNYDLDRVFLVRPRPTGDALPRLKFSNVSLNEQSVGDALRNILRDTGIALVFQGGRRGDADVYGAVTVERLSGTLSEVLDQISKITGYWYSYDGNAKVLTVRPSDHFVMTMPPAVGADTYTGMSNTLVNLGAHSILQDTANRTLVFHANRIAFEKIQQYLSEIRESQVLLIYDISIYKVALTSNFSAGIAWSQMENSNGWSLIGGQTITNGLEASFTFSGIGAAQKVIPSLLQQFGKVKSVGNPKITFMSGGWGHFRQGRETTYVGKVGNNFANTVNSVTVETATATSGTELDVTADILGDTVQTQIKLRTADIIKFNPYTALGTQLSLPDKATQEIDTVVRSPVGKAVLLGGIIVSSAAGDVGGLPVGHERTVPVSATSATEDSELVMVIRPHVVRFTSKKPAAGNPGVSSGATGPVPSAKADEAVAAKSAAPKEQSLAQAAPTKDSPAATVQTSSPAVKPVQPASPGPAKPADPKADTTSQAVGGATPSPVVPAALPGSAAAAPLHQLPQATAPNVPAAARTEQPMALPPQVGQWPSRGVPATPMNYYWR